MPGVIEIETTLDPRLHDITRELDRVVDRVKPWFMVYGSWFMVLFMVLFMILFMVWCLVWCMVWYMVWFMLHSNILIRKGLLWTETGDDSGLVTFFDASCSSSH